MAVTTHRKAKASSAKPAPKSTAGKRGPSRPAAKSAAAKRPTPSKAKAGENKTKATSASVAKFLAAVPDPKRRAEAGVVLEMMRRVTGHEPRMWGPSIVGFGSYHYRYESGREGDMIRSGFSPRKAALTLYIMDGFPRYDALMKRLGPYTTGSSCLYIKRLADVDLGVLEALVRESWAYMAKRYPELK